MPTLRTEKYDAALRLCHEASFRVFFGGCRERKMMESKERIMKFLKLSIVVAFVALLAAACGQSVSNNAVTTSNSVKNTPVNTAPTTPAPVDELAGAKKIFTEKCVGCHKETGTGGEKDVDGVKIKVPDFTSEKLKAEPDAEFTDIIKNGEKEEGMPSFKDKLSEQEIKDLVRLIRRDFQKK
jgi:mono/diheme cytochrome c family protein